MVNTLIIPTDLAFEDLDLQRSQETHNLLFSPATLAEVCRCSGLDPVAVLADKDLSCWVICEWYVAHIAAGGAPDAVAEQMLTEASAAQESRIAALQLGAGYEH